MAAATPLPNSNLIPTSYIASSAVEIAPNIIVLLRSPKCPILNSLPATLFNPPPKEVLYLLRRQMLTRTLYTRMDCSGIVSCRQLNLSRNILM